MTKKVYEIGTPIANFHILSKHEDNLTRCEGTLFFRVPDLSFWPSCDCNEIVNHTWKKQVESCPSHDMALKYQREFEKELTTIMVFKAVVIVPGNVCLGGKALLPSLHSYCNVTRLSVGQTFNSFSSHFSLHVNRKRYIPQIN
jgi:hypothetical protein